MSICQEQYIRNLLKKYEISNSSSVKILMVPPNNLGPDLAGKLVNETLYRAMIGSLMYLTATRPDIQFSTCLCARYQTSPKESHLTTVKRNLRHLKGTSSICLYYQKCSGFDLKGYSDSDYAGCNIDRKSTSGACQILRVKLVCWSAKKHHLEDSVHICNSCSRGNYSSADQINSIQQMIAYCLMNRIKVDIREIIYSDLVTKLTSKSRLKYVSYSRFISCALKVLLGTQYTQDEKFRSLLGILRALSKKRNRPKPKNTTLETQATPPNVKTEDYEKTHSVSSGQTAHPQDTEENIQFIVKGFYSPLDEGTCSLKPFPKGKPTDAKDPEGNIQPVGMGLPSTSLDEGIRTSQLLPEGKTIDPTDSGGNIQPIDKGLPSTVPNEGIGKTKILSEGPHGDKDSEGFKPPVDMEPLTTPVTDPQTLLRATVADV
uniref:Uncharacterized mitochondrial protein AtMg00810-like n=1 Tax=Tanacetum cinerariifolium TaxID=118510 RepID=A0A699H237_TANCI|nr:uncharacterized mitochondrial protein AtMg00810-like [Tanacetum cinerariifolium]